MQTSPNRVSSQASTNAQAANFTDGVEELTEADGQQASAAVTETEATDDATTGPASVAVIVTPTQPGGLSFLENLFSKNQITPQDPDTPSADELLKLLRKLHTQGKTDPKQAQYVHLVALNLYDALNLENNAEIAQGIKDRKEFLKPGSLKLTKYSVNPLNLDSSMLGGVNLGIGGSRTDLQLSTENGLMLEIGGYSGDLSLGGSVGMAGINSNISAAKSKAKVYFSSKDLYDKNFTKFIKQYLTNNESKHLIECVSNTDANNLEIARHFTELNASLRQDGFFIDEANFPFTKAPSGTDSYQLAGGVSANVGISLEANNPLTTLGATLASNGEMIDINIYDRPKFHEELKDFSAIAHTKYSIERTKRLAELLQTYQLLKADYLSRNPLQINPPDNGGITDESTLTNSQKQNLQSVQKLTPEQIEEILKSVTRDIQRLDTQQDTCLEKILKRVFGMDSKKDKVLKNYCILLTGLNYELTLLKAEKKSQQSTKIKAQEKAEWTKLIDGYTQLLRHLDDIDHLLCVHEDKILTTQMSESPHSKDLNNIMERRFGSENEITPLKERIIRECTSLKTGETLSADDITKLSQTLQESATTVDIFLVDVKQALAPLGIGTKLPDTHAPAKTSSSFASQPSSSPNAENKPVKRQNLGSNNPDYNKVMTGIFKANQDTIEKLNTDKIDQLLATSNRLYEKLFAQDNNKATTLKNSFTVTVKDIALSLNSAFGFLGADATAKYVRKKDIDYYYSGDYLYLNLTGTAGMNVNSVIKCLSNKLGLSLEQLAGIGDALNHINFSAGVGQSYQFVFNKPTYKDSFEPFAIYTTKHDTRSVNLSLPYVPSPSASYFHLDATTKEVSHLPEQINTLMMHYQIARIGPTWEEFKTEHKDFIKKLITNIGDNKNNLRADMHFLTGLYDKHNAKLKAPNLFKQTDLEGFYQRCQDFKESKVSYEEVLTELERFLTASHQHYSDHCNEYDGKKASPGHFKFRRF